MLDGEWLHHWLSGLLMYLKWLCMYLTRIEHATWQYSMGRYYEFFDGTGCALAELRRSSLCLISNYKLWEHSLLYLLIIIGKYYPLDEHRNVRCTLAFSAVLSSIWGAYAHFRGLTELLDCPIRFQVS